MRIKIITGYDGQCSFANLTMPSIHSYCLQHGYDFVSKIDNWKPLEVSYQGKKDPLALTWRKVEMCREHISSCDWLVWFDIDVVVLNQAIKLESILNTPANLVVPGPFESCYGCGNPVFNTGVYAIRNCDWTLQMLEDWWDTRDKYLHIDSPKDCHWSKEILARWWSPQKQSDGFRPELYGCPWLGEMGFFSCRICNNPSLVSQIKIVPLEIMGWATITNKPEQFITHQYGAPEEQKFQTIKHLLSRI